MVDVGYIHSPFMYQDDAAGSRISNVCGCGQLDGEQRGIASLFVMIMWLGLAIFVMKM